MRKLTEEEKLEAIDGFYFNYFSNPQNINLDSMNEKGLLFLDYLACNGEEKIPKYIHFRKQWFPTDSRCRSLSKTVILYARERVTYLYAQRDNDIEQMKTSRYRMIFLYETIKKNIDGSFNWKNHMTKQRLQKELYEKNNKEYSEYVEFDIYHKKPLDK